MKNSRQESLGISQNSKKMFYISHNLEFIYADNTNNLVLFSIKL